MSDPCPCGSGRAYPACCGPYLDQSLPAPTAEALMRARYTAYTLKREDYLLATWDPAHRPAQLDADEHQVDGGRVTDAGRIDGGTSSVISVS